MDMWNSLAGYVMIKLEGVGLERFVNRAMEAGLSIWNVQRTGRNTMTANVSVGSFYALRKLNRNLAAVSISWKSMACPSPYPGCGFARCWPWAGSPYWRRCC